MRYPPLTASTIPSSQATDAELAAGLSALVGGATSAADTLGEVETLLASKAPTASPIFTGLVGINCTPNASFPLDVQGYFRAHDSSGRGVEFQGGETCYLSAYDRASPAYLPIEITGTTITLQPSGAGSGLRVGANGNVSIGTLTSPTANATKILVFGNNGSTDPTLGANTCAVYQKNGELYHMDAAGNVTLSSPHAIDEAIAAGLDIPEEDMHPSIGLSFNVYTGYGKCTYKDQEVIFQIPTETKQDWELNQLATAEQVQVDRCQYEISKAMYPNKELTLTKPEDYIPVDPPLWLQKRGVACINKEAIQSHIAALKLQLAEVASSEVTRLQAIIAEESIAKAAEESA